MTNTTYKVLLLAGIFAASCVPAFAQPYASLEEQKAARLKTIDAALAKAELEFFEQEAAPDLVTQEEPPAVLSSTGENTFSVSEADARENVPEAEAPKHLFEIDAEVFSFKYEEPDLMKDAGVMSGLYGRYSYRPDRENFLYTGTVNLYRLEGRYSFGEVDYEAENGSTIDDIDDWSAELRGLFGKEYVKTPFSVALYSGVGYRYLTDNTSGRTSTVGGITYIGYKRESNYYYIPIGIEFSNRFNNRWSAVITGEWDWLAYGLQISHLSDTNRLGLISTDAENEQHHGYGVRGSLRLIHEWEAVSIVLEPFIRYWQIEDSDLTSVLLDGTPATGLEPHNNTLETGLKFGLLF